MMTILELIEKESSHTYRREGRNYRGPCPFCGGSSRFTINNDKDIFKCWVCDQGGDQVWFLRAYKKMSKVQAYEHLGLPNDGRQSRPAKGFRLPTESPKISTDRQTPPEALWAEQAWQFVFQCQPRLMDEEQGQKARAWLYKRGLREETLREFGIGYNPVDHYQDREAWGLEPELNRQGRPKGIWLPRGIVIPWIVDNELWGIRIRRPVVRKEDGPKYYFVPGGTPALFNADQIRAGEPVLLLEGEIDTLIAHQEAEDIINAVATGSTTGARRIKWLARLATASIVLIAYDTDENQAGDKAATYWLDALTHAKRLRPYWADVNEMYTGRANLRRWLWRGLGVSIPMQDVEKRDQAIQELRMGQ